MSISHRTNRLKLFGIPAVEQLQNGRYQLTVNCTTMNSREDWYSANKARIFPDFGSLQSAEMSIDGLAPRTGEAYADMRLVSVQSSTQGEDYIVTLVYQTLGATFVQVKDDDISEGETGLRIVNRTIIAEAGTDYVDGSVPPVLKQVGVTTINSKVDAENAVSCTLASYEIVDTDSYREVKEVYMQPGTLSETKDKVGSQLSIVKETFASTPSAISGYSIANERESNVDGIPTKQFTFLKDNVILSVSQDRVGSQLSVTNQVFKPTSDAFAGKDVDGDALVGYSEATREKSNFAGIPTISYTFLKDDVKLSQSDDKVGSQQAITEQWFKPDLNASPDPSGNPPTYNRSVKAGYELAKEQESDVEGIPTLAYTFLKPDVKLSDSEDKVGSQLAITEQWFKPSLIADSTTDPVTVDHRIKTGYSLAKRDISDVEGIPTERYTFLKDDVKLSDSNDKVGSQLAITEEWFKPVVSDPSATPPVVGREVKANYELAREEVSDVEGIPTRRYTFLKSDVKLSESEDEVGSQNAITEQWFKPTNSRKIKANYSLAKEDVSDVQGIPTEAYTFLKDDVQLSNSEDKAGSQNTITEQWFNPTVSDPGATPPVIGRDVKDGYSLMDEQKSDFSGIPTIRYTFSENDVKLSDSTDKVGSQNAIVEEWFNPSLIAAPNANPATVDRRIKAGYSLAKEEISDVEGIPTRRFTFLKDDVKLSDSEDKVGSQNAITEQWFKPVASDPSATPPVVGREIKAGYSLAKEDVSDVEGIPTKRFTFLKPSILSIKQDFSNGLKAVTVRAFNLTKSGVESELISNPPNAGDILTAAHVLLSQEESDFQGIKTTVFIFQINEVFTEDYELNGLKRIEQRELSSSSFTARVIGGIAGEAATPPATDPPNVVPAGSPVIGLYLSTEEIDNGGDVKTRVSNWIESGTLKKETRNISDGLVEHTTKYIAAKGTAVGPVVDESIDNFEGLQLFNVVDIRTSSGATPVPPLGTPLLVNSFKNNVPFKYPGVVSLQHDQVYYSNTEFNNVLSFQMTPPVEATVFAQVDVYIQDSGSIVAADYIHTPSGSGNSASVGYWNPTAWAEAYQGGYAWGGTPFSETQGLRGYRVNPDTSNIQTITSSGSVRTYLSNGVTIAQQRIQSLDGFLVEQFEYTNNGGLYSPTASLWTGQTSGAKGYAKLYGNRDSGVFGFLRSGSGSNTIPFLSGENVRSAQYGGNQKLLGRSLGNAAYAVGTADSQGYAFSVNSKRIYGATPFQMKLSGGPENPSSKQWVLDVKLEPAFEGSDGTQYYRKTIVTSTIP